MVSKSKKAATRRKAKRRTVQPLCKTCRDGAKAALENTGRIWGFEVDSRPLDQSHRGINDGDRGPSLLPFGPPDYRYPQLHARSREIQTGGQRPPIAGNLRIKHLDGPGRDDLTFLTDDGRHVWQPQVIASLSDTDHRTCGYRHLIAQIWKGHPYGW